MFSKADCKSMPTKWDFLLLFMRLSKEGPSHEPTFTSTIIVNNVRYDSLPGFYNRKATEQSAAEVALMRLGNSGSMENLSLPVTLGIRKNIWIWDWLTLTLARKRGLSSCYVFKNQLQEYAQKAGLPIPVYEIIKEGPSHKPTFMSTVIVDNVRFDSLPGFHNHKAAEQSAAEVALMRLGESVHETRLCKNLLQHYAQKMNFAPPQYECQRYDTESKMVTFSCSVDIGGMKYVGSAARTKKEAEIKAARTALLALQFSDMGSNSSGYTVIPVKKVADVGISNQESAAALRPKKKQKREVLAISDHHVHTMNTGESQAQMVNQAKPELHENAAIGTQSTESGPAPFAATVGDLVPSNDWSSDYGTSNL